MKVGGRDWGVEASRFHLRGQDRMDRRENAVYRERAGSAQEAVRPVQVLALTCSVFLANLVPPPGLSFLSSKKEVVGLR